MEELKKAERELCDSFEFTKGVPLMKIPAETSASPDNSSYWYDRHMKYGDLLFDLKEDPEECRDLAGDPEYCEVIRRMEKELRTLVDPEKAEEDARIAQRALLDRFGGQEAFLKTFHPSLFSPIPDLEEK